MGNHSRKLRHRFLFFYGPILFTSGFFVTITRGFNMADESWFLHVIHRVTNGDVLYRDVFFGATPLSVYIARVFATFFGIEILVVKILVVLCFVFTVLLSCRIAQQLASSCGFPLLLTLTQLVYLSPGVPVAGSFYSPLAIFFFLGCFSAILVWWQNDQLESSVFKGRFKSGAALTTAGVMAGLCFASKQNLGIYALAALILTVAIDSREKASKGPTLIVSLFFILIGFLSISILTLLPVWISGGTDRFLDYGFMNKLTYLRLGRISYFDGLKWMILQEKNPKLIYWQVLFLVPPATFIALFMAWHRASLKERGRAILVFLFVGAGFMVVFPRADIAHLSYAVPVLLLGLTYAWYCVKPKFPRLWVRLVRGGILLWISVGLGYWFINPLIDIASGKNRMSTLPHFRGVFIETSKEAVIRAHVSAIRESVAGEHLFFLTPNAGFYYLVTGLRNPTPFDYPLVTAFGLTGQAEVIGAISRQQIRTVCLDSQGLSPLNPFPLEEYVQNHMVTGPNVGFCTLYLVGPR